MNNKIKYLIEDFLGFNPAEIGKKNKYDRLRDDIRSKTINDLQTMKYNKTEYPEDMEGYDVDKAYEYAQIGEIICEYLTNLHGGFIDYYFNVYFKGGKEMQLYDFTNIWMQTSSGSEPVARVQLDEEDPYTITSFYQDSIWYHKGGSNRPFTISMGRKDSSSHYTISSNYTDFVKYLADNGYKINVYYINNQDREALSGIRLQLCKKTITEKVVDNLPYIMISYETSPDEYNVSSSPLFMLKVSPNFTFIFDKDTIFDNVQTLEKFIDKICEQGVKRIKIDYEPVIENKDEQDVPWGYTLCGYTIAKQCQKHKIPLAMETYKRKQIVTLQGNQCLLDKGIIDLETLRGKGEYEMRFYSYVDKIQAQAKSKGGNRYYLFRYHAEWGPTNDKHWAEIIFRNYYSSICEIERIEYLDQVYRDGKTIDLSAEK